MSFHSHVLQRLLSFSLLLLALTACKEEEPEAVTPQPATTVYNHTVVAYIVAENSIAEQLRMDMYEMIKGRDSIPQDGQMLIYIDDEREPRLYRLTADADTVRLHTWSTDIISTDSAFMCDVFDKIIEYSPSCQRYDLIMNSHASGWIPQKSFNAPTRSFGIDNNRNNGSNVGTELNITTLRDIISTKLGHVGYIFFDACYMQCIEVAHELRTVAEYIVASPTEIPGDGANYTHMMPHLFANDAPARIVEQYYADEVAKNSRYAGVVISAVNTAATPALALATQPIVHQLCDGHQTPNTTGVQTYGVYHYQTSYRPTYYDMLGLALLTQDEQALNAFRLQLEFAVPAYRATSQWLTVFSFIFSPTMPDITRTCGVSMFLPDEGYNKQQWNTYYHDTQWYTDAGYNTTGW